MSIPPSGQRVPYVIVYGEPGRPLFHSVRSPQEVLEAQYPKGDTVGLLRPNTHYYITKVIVPALNRCFSLIGADVMKWWADLWFRVQKNGLWCFSKCSVCLCSLGSKKCPKFSRDRWWCWNRTTTWSPPRQTWFTSISRPDWVPDLFEAVVENLVVMRRWEGPRDKGWSFSIFQG